MLKSRKWIMLTFVVLFLFISSSSDGQFESLAKDYGDFPGWFSVSSENLPGPADYPATGGVYLRTEYEVLLLGPSDEFRMVFLRFKQRSHDLYLVLDERGLEEVLKLKIPSAIRLDYRLIRDGKTLREVHADPDHNINNADWDFSEVKPGDIFELYYEIYTNYNTVFTDTHFINRNHPVVQSELRLISSDATAPEKFVRLYNCQKNFSHDPKKRLFSMNFENLPAVPDEPKSPPREDEAVWMQICVEMAAVTSGSPFLDQFVPIHEYFGTTSSWDGIPRASRVTGQSLDYVAGLDNLSEMTKMLRKSGDGKDAIKAAYEFVMSESSRQGIFTSDVNLLDLLLTQLGYKPDVILLRSANLGALDLGWPSTYQFNRKLLRVNIDGEEIWMDPMFVGCPFGQLPWFDYDAWIFVPSKDVMDPPLVTAFQKNDPQKCKNCPEKTGPAPEICQNIRRETIIEVGETIRTKTTITLDGWHAMSARNWILRTRSAKIDDKKAIVKYFQPGKAYKDAEIESVSFEHLEDFADTMIIRIVMNQNRNSPEIPPPFLPDVFYFDNDYRIRDILFPVKVKDYSVVSYHNISEASLPSELVVNEDFASISAKVSKSHDEVVLEISLEQKARRIPASSYSQVRNFQSRMTAWASEIRI